MRHDSTIARLPSGFKQFGWHSPTSAGVGEAGSGGDGGDGGAPGMGRGGGIAGGMDGLSGGDGGLGGWNGGGFGGENTEHAVSTIASAPAMSTCSEIECAVAFGANTKTLPLPSMLVTLQFINEVGRRFKPPADRKDSASRCGVTPEASFKSILSTAACGLCANGVINTSEMDGHGETDQAGGQWVDE